MLELIRMISFAIVGRPNVGKSTLFNRMLGKRRAVVADMPGVTRDWQAYECTFQGLKLRLYDTPGLETDWEGIKDLDIQGLIWVIDGEHGPTASDYELATWIRKLCIPVVLVANKCEGPQAYDNASESARLGFGMPVPISALHGQGMINLAMALLPYVENSSNALQNELHQEDFFSVVILGRPNVGKSTLINSFLGYDRMLTSPKAGTTVDAVGTITKWKNRTFRLIDTAGMRKRANVKGNLERSACQEAYRALVFAHVAVVVVEATQEPTRQDLLLIDKVQEEGRALVIAVNKWDQVDDPKEYMYQINSMLPNCTVVPISCYTGYGLSLLWDTVIRCYDKWNFRLPTGPLNRWLQKQIEMHAPPMIKGKRIKIKYITQVKSRPPTIALFGHGVEKLPPEYRRYLINNLKKEFGLTSTKLICNDAYNPYKRES